MIDKLDNETIVLINDKYSEEELEHLFAIKALRANPSIIENIFIFEKLCYVFNKLKSNVDTFEPPSILQIAKAVKYIKENFDENIEFNREIKEYIAHIAHDEGWYKLPDILLFAQPELDNLHKNHELDNDMMEIQKLKHLAVSKYLEL